MTLVGWYEAEIGVEFPQMPSHVRYFPRQPYDI